MTIPIVFHVQDLLNLFLIESNGPKATTLFFFQFKETIAKWLYDWTELLFKVFRWMRTLLNNHVFLEFNDNT